MDIDNMTPGEVALTRRIEMLESKLAQYEAPFQPTYMTEDPPSIIDVHEITTPMTLAIKARVKSDDRNGYHLYTRDVRTGYSINYYVSDKELNINRYRIAEFMNEMMREITRALAHDIEKGIA